MILPYFTFGSSFQFFTEIDYENSPENVLLTERLRKTLYYGKMPTVQRPSLAMTELAVELLHDLAPKEFGKIDMYHASELSRELCASPCSLMLALIYVKRLKEKNSGFLHQVSSSDLFLVAMMIASKYLYDEGEVDEVVNDAWAQSANIDIDEINQLERAFLSAIDWNLFVNNADFWAALLLMEEKIAWKQMRQHGGSLTYSDCDVLTESGQLSTYFICCLIDAYKVLAVCILSYVACLVPLITVPIGLSFVQSEVTPVLSIIQSDAMFYAALPYICVPSVIKLSGYGLLHASDVMLSTGFENAPHLWETSYVSFAEQNEQIFNESLSVDGNNTTSVKVLKNEAEKISSDPSSTLIPTPPKFSRLFVTVTLALDVFSKSLLSMLPRQLNPARASHSHGDHRTSWKSADGGQTSQTLDTVNDASAASVRVQVAQSVCGRRFRERCYRKRGKRFHQTITAPCSIKSDSPSIPYFTWSSTGCGQASLSNQASSNDRTCSDVSRQSPSRFTEPPSINVVLRSNETLPCNEEVCHLSTKVTSTPALSSDIILPKFAEPSHSSNNVQRHDLLSIELYQSDWRNEYDHSHKALELRMNERGTTFEFL